MPRSIVSTASDSVVMVETAIVFSFVRLKARANGNADSAQVHLHNMNLHIRWSPLASIL